MEDTDDPKRWQEIFVRAPRPQEPSLPHVPTKVRLAQQINAGEASSRTPLSIPLPTYKRKTSEDFSRENQAELLSRPTKRMRPLGESTINHDRAPLVIMRMQSPWQTVKRLGVFKQGSTRWTICAPKEDFLDLIMFEELDKKAGITKFNLLKNLSHPNIIKLKHAFIHDNLVYLGLEYCRHTVQELIHVHIPLEEYHIRVLAKSVGNRSVAISSN